MSNLAKRRTGILRVSPEFVVKNLPIPDELKSAFTGKATYDFDTGTFKLEFEHEKIPQHRDGEPKPTISIVYGEESTGWIAT